MKTHAWLTAGMALFALPSSALTLTDAYRIVVPEDDRTGVSRAILAGARELAHDLEEGSGLKLPVVTASKVGAGRSIYIGREFAAKAGLLPSGKDALVGWENVVAEKDGNLYLFGEDHPGLASKKPLDWTNCITPSLKALANFMETEMGVAFLYPGAIGREVPKRDKIEVRDGLYRRQKPWVWFDAGRCQEMMHSIANNVFGAGGWKSYGGHLYPYAVPAEKYYKTHPEYYALVGNARHYCPKNEPLCVSNPDVEELVLKEVSDRFDEGYEIVELSQQDGGLYCHCDNCRRMAGEGNPPGEMFWIFHRRIAEKLYKRYPDRTVLIISYAQTYNPPKTFRDFPPNVMIELCNYEEESFRMWKDYTVPKGYTIYTYTWGTYQLTGYTPLGSSVYVAEAVRRLHRNNVHGIYRCGYGEKFGLEGPSYAVFSRLLQEPSLDTQAVYDDFSLKAFGPAGETMRKFFAALDFRLRGFDKLREGFHCHGAGLKVVPAEPKSPNDTFAYIYAPEVLRELETLLARAEKTPGLSEKHAKRLKLVRTEFDYAAKIARTVHLYNGYRTAPSVELYRPLANAIKARKAYVDSLFDEKGRLRPIDGWKEMTPFRGANRATLTCNGYLKAILPAPFGWDVDFLASQGILPGMAGAKSMTVRRTAEKPSLADFEKGAWAAATWQELVGHQLERVTADSRFKLLYDDRNLYFALDTKLSDASMDEIKSLGQDGPLWRQEAFELFIDPFGSREKFYHLIVNPIADSRYDASFGFVDDPLNPYYAKDQPAWNGDWSFDFRREGGRWRTLVTVPFKTLGVPTPAKGCRMCLNVAREAGRNGASMRRSVDIEYGAWSPDLETGTLGSREAMGELVFD